MSGSLFSSNQPGEPLFVDRRLMKASLMKDGRWLIESHLADSYGHWSISRASGLAIARECGVPVTKFELLKQPEAVAIQHPFAKSDDLTSHWPAMTLFDEGIKPGFEEEGGAGLERCLTFINQNSSSPIVDIHKFLRWVLISFLLGNTEQHAGHLALINIGTGWRLAPFGWMTIFPAVASPGRYPLAKGMRIGTWWPDDDLLVSGWISLAKWAGVHPKIIFNMGNELTQTVVQSLQDEFEKHYGKDNPFRTPNRMIQLVKQRSQRLKELYMAAPGQGVSGIKRAEIISSKIYCSDD